MITIVHGAPCSGKTTYVQEHIKPNDLVFDWDAIEYAISGNEYQKKNPNLSSLVRKIRTAVVDECLTNANIEDKWLVATTLSQGLIELLQTADELTIK
ncbi:MAG: ATP-binding protein [Pisciglobus halotolerans]|nr:ATP-binding protein [Pisciglobus halotolerans]